ncbi:MAG: hypothetical protein JNK85_07770 [Verrucomicrobiales bacterium]|nr:hypothetical protein [Verrucomicrobiales bacterium]
MKDHRKLPVQEAFELPTAVVAGDPRYTAGMTPYEEDLTPFQRRLSAVCRWVAAVIMLETLWFKFTGHPESVWIFSKMGMESWWRYGQGFWELAASVFLFLPRTIWLGCLLALGAMSAALLSHFAVIGIEVQGDGGLLFGMGVIAWLTSFVATWLHQQSIPYITRLDD